MEDQTKPTEEQLTNEQPSTENPTEGSTAEGSTAKKKKVSLSDFKVKSFVSNVKVEQMQFLKTAGG
jgi:hypothetical protein